MYNRKRLPHTIKANFECKAPTHFVFLDTETKLEDINSKTTKHTFKLGWTVYWHRSNKEENDILEQELHYSTESMNRVIVEKAECCKELWVIASNMNYDLSILSLDKYLIEQGFHISFLHAHKGSYVVCLKKGKHKIALLSLQNWGVKSVEKAGEALGYPKLKVDFDNVTDEELANYCLRDTLIMYRYMKFLIDTLINNDLGSLGMTAGSTAFNSLNHKFRNWPIHIHCNQEVLTLERKAYHGGRTEVFRTGVFDNGKYYKLDINSAYPAVMRDYRYPTKLLWTEDTPSIERLKYLLPKGCIIADVKIHPKRPIYVTKLNGKNIYPLYPFRTVLTTEELKEAVEHNEIIKVYKIAVYKAKPLFRDFIKYYYKKKAEASRKGNKALKTVWKLFLNTLYGKFGQKGKKYVRDKSLEGLDIKYTSVVDGVTGKRKQVVYFAGIAYVAEEEGETFNSFPAIAAEITANARLLLAKYIQIAERNNLFYSDTDSLIVNRKGKENVKKYIHKTRLGALKIEGISDKVEIYGRKHYIFDNEIVLKGVPKNATNLGNGEYICTYWDSSRRTSKYTERCVYYTRKVKKKVEPYVYDGIVSPTGYVIPYTSPSQFSITYTQA